MSITAVIGAQFGSEGKGKICAYLSREMRHSVRTGGANAGHTVVENGTSRVFRHLPCAAVHPAVKLYLGAGAVIDCSVLYGELEHTVSAAHRLVIDPQAAIITSEDLLAEAVIQESIGSTGKGVGMALQKKIARDGTATLARDVPGLEAYLNAVSDILCEACAHGEPIMLEGTQGTGLSLHHGAYPFVTSRDVTVGSLCGEAGLPPNAVQRAVLVVRPYPIRVSGNSGPLHGEITWDTVKQRSGSTYSLVERTTVTGNIRRVGEFDLQAVKRAARMNGATDIALTFADHLDARCYGTTVRRQLPNPVLRFIEMLEHGVDLPVSLVSTGPETAQIIDLR